MPQTAEWRLSVFLWSAVTLRQRSWRTRNSKKCMMWQRERIRKSSNVSSKNTGHINSNFRTGIQKTEYINPVYDSAILPNCLQMFSRDFELFLLTQRKGSHRLLGKVLTVLFVRLRRHLWREAKVSEGSSYLGKKQFKSGRSGGLFWNWCK